MKTVTRVDESLLSNMENKDKAIIVKAIELSGYSDIIYITDKAIDDRGRILKKCFAVHTLSRRKDLSKFWRKFEELK